MKTKPHSVIKEGCVTIKLHDSNGKQCVTLIIDFGKTDIDPWSAATAIKRIVAVLRKELGLELPEFKEE